MDDTIVGVSGSILTALASRLPTGGLNYSAPPVNQAGQPINPTENFRFSSEANTLEEFAALAANGTIHAWPDDNTLCCASNVRVPRGTRPSSSSARAVCA